MKQKNELTPLYYQARSLFAIFEDSLLSFSHYASDEKEKEKILRNLLDNFISKASSIYTGFISTFPDTFSECSWQNAENQETEEKNKGGKIVQAAEFKQCVFIKMPILWKRVPRTVTVTSVSYAHSCVIDSSPFYTNEIKQALYPFKNLLFCYRETTIMYNFVHPKEQVFAMDNDNYDTKSITDAITSYFLDGDSPRSCRFVYQSFFTDELEPGTYIALIPSFDKVATKPFLLHTFDTLFSTLKEGR